MQPLIAAQPLTMPPVPVSAVAPGTDGQLTVVPTLLAAHPLGSWAFRYEVVRKVLPELSARCRGTILVLGSDTPLLSAVIAGLFQVVILPE